VTEHVGNGYRTFADFAYRHLRRAILTGELAPGSRVDQNAEASRLGASRMPIREALRRLESEGLVEIMRHRGAIVRPLTFADLEDLYVLRIALEGTAGRLGAARLDEAALARMRGLLPEMAAIVARHDPAAWIEVDWPFHAALYQAAGHPRLLATIRTLREEVGRYRLLGLAQPRELESSLAGHEAILTAGARRDGAEVERIIRTSLEHTRDCLRDLLAQHADEVGRLAEVAKEDRHGRTAHSR
jgi:DNA-binding GntR family transcriptional regulator